MSRIIEKIKEINARYKNYIPADLWAFLIFILVFVLGVIFLW